MGTTDRPEQPSYASMCINRSLSSLLMLCACSMLAHAQSDSVDAPFWVQRELRYWQGLPMTGGPNGACIAGYTDEDSRVYFFADGGFQEISFELRYSTRLVFNLEKNACGILTGDSISLQNGSWELVGDTLWVTVESTGVYAYQPFLNEYVDRDAEKPFRPSVPASRTCTMPRERWLLIGNDVLEEQSRTWR